MVGLLVLIMERRAFVVHGDCFPLIAALPLQALHCLQVVMLS